MNINTLLDILNPDNTISVNRPLAHEIGLHEAIVYAAIVAKYCYYKKRKKLNKGWFYSTITDMQESTTLSASQQKHCIDKLVEKGLIKCDRNTCQAKRRFQVCMNPDVLSMYIESGSAKMSRASTNKQNNGFSDSFDDEEDETKKCAKGNIKNPRNFESASTKNTNIVSQKDDMQSLQNDESLLKKSKANESIVNYQSIQSINSANYVMDRMKYENIAKESKKELNAMGERKERERTFKNNTNDSIDSNSIRSITSVDMRNKCQERIKRNIDYDELINDKRGFRSEIDNIIAIMTDVICSQSRFIHVNGEEMPHEVVEKRYLELTYEDIDYILNAIQNKANKINNIRSYLITALYNSHATQSIGAFAEACTEM